MNKKIREILRKISGIEEISVFIPEHEAHGHYSTNIAMRLAKEAKRQPMELANEIAEKVEKSAPKNLFEKIEAAPAGFVYFWLAPQAIQEEFSGFSYGFS